MVLSACALVLFLPQSLQAEELSNNTYKFDGRFYDKITAVLFGSAVSGLDDTASDYYPMILITHDKDDLVNDLADDYDARNVFNPEYLSDELSFTAGEK